MMHSNKISKYGREEDENRWQQKTKIKEKKKQRKQRRSEKGLMF